MAGATEKNGAAGEKLPRHIAIIMDGNGRWAKKRGLPRKAGHAVGAETFRRIATYCKNLGVQYLTVYAFSTENWKRSETVLAQHLMVMDSTATSLSMDNHIPVLLFALKDPENIIRAVCGEKIGTIVKE